MLLGDDGSHVEVDRLDNELGRGFGGLTVGSGSNNGDIVLSGHGGVLSNDGDLGSEEVSLGEDVLAIDGVIPFVDNLVVVAEGLDRSSKGHLAERVNSSSRFGHGVSSVNGKVFHGLIVTVFADQHEVSVVWQTGEGRNVVDTHLNMGNVAHALALLGIDTVDTRGSIVAGEDDDLFAEEAEVHDLHVLLDSETEGSGLGQVSVCFKVGD